MTSATDNRTTELESLSKLKTAGRLHYWRGTIEIPETELHAICDEIQAEHDKAVAAWNTRAELGSTCPFARPTDLTDGCAALERIAELEAELGSGMLTAEQVREAVLKHGNVMGPRFYGDWQAIADELNAELRKVVSE